MWGMPSHCGLPQWVLFIIGGGVECGVNVEERRGKGQRNAKVHVSHTSSVSHDFGSLTNTVTLIMLDFYVSSPTFIPRSTLPPMTMST